MSSPSGERGSVLPVGGSPRTSYHRTVPESVLPPTIIEMSRLDLQGRCSSPPASGTSNTEGRASDSTHDSTRASNSSQRPETNVPPGVLNADVSVGQGLMPSQMPRQPFFKRCLTWMDSNKIDTLMGTLGFLVSIVVLYMTARSYRIANNAYTMERWRDCQDRPVRTTYGSTSR